MIMQQRSPQQGLSNGENRMLLLSPVPKLQLCNGPAVLLLLRKLNVHVKSKCPPKSWRGPGATLLGFMMSIFGEGISWVSSCSLQDKILLFAARSPGSLFLCSQKVGFSSLSRRSPMWQVAHLALQSLEHVKAAA